MDLFASLFIHCSTRRFWEPEFEGSSLNLAGWTRQLTGKPTITVGSVGLDDEFLQYMVKTDKVAQPANIEGLLERLNRQEFDLVAVGRALWSIRTGRRRCAKGGCRTCCHSAARR